MKHASLSEILKTIERQLATPNLPKTLDSYSSFSASMVSHYRDKKVHIFVHYHKMRFYATHMWFDKQGLNPWEKC